MTKQEKQLLEERNRAATQMRALVDAAEAEDRGLTAEERSTWDAMGADIEKIDSRVDVLRRQSGIDAEAVAAIGSESRTETGSKDQGESRAQVFSAFTRSHPDYSPLTPEQRKALVEMRAQAAGTDSAGGYVVPEEWANSIESAMKAYGGIRNAATIIRSSNGGDLHMPTDDDTSNTGAILAENTQDSEQDVTFGEVVLGAYNYTSKIIRVPIALMQDSAFPLDAFLQRKFAERLGRATAAHYATGTGTAQPKGLFTAASSGKTAASATAVTYSELIDLKHSVDPAYRQNASWVFNDSTLKALKQLLDSDGRPLWAPGIAGGVPATLDDDVYIIDQGAASMATTTTPIAYGDISKYMIRDVAGFTMLRLVERYADYHQVGFVAFLRTDGDLLDAGQGPVKKLTMA